jgi:hypothetical protein
VNATLGQQQPDGSIFNIRGMTRVLGACTKGGDSGGAVVVLQPDGRSVYAAGIHSSGGWITDDLTRRYGSDTCPREVGRDPMERTSSYSPIGDILRASGLRLRIAGTPTAVVSRLSLPYEGRAGTARPIA